MNQWFGVTESEIQRVMDNKPDLNKELAIFRTKDQIDNNIKGKLKLITVFPNPFTDYTTIRFISGNGKARLSLIDTAGKTVRVLLEESINEGQHEVTLHRNGLSDGVYYVHLKQGNEKDTLLLKTM
ncbi:hypothetical protein D3C86_1727720 [compost metagenome]